MPAQVKQQQYGNQAPAFADIIYPVTSFAGGLNTKASQIFLGRQDRYALKPDQLTRCENMIRNASGQLETRPGYRLLGAVPAPGAGTSQIRDGFEIRKSDGTYVIICHAGNTIYKWNGSAWVSIGTVSTANTRFHWTQFKDKAVGFDGINTPIETNGTTVTNLTGTPPTASICYSFRNRVYALGLQTLYWCALGNENDWTTVNNAGSIPVPVNRGGYGTGLIGFWDRLIVFMSSGVWQMVGVDPAVLSLLPVNMVHGHTGSPYGVVLAGNDIYYCNGKGVHSLSVSLARSELGDVVWDYESGIIEPSWGQLTNTNIANIVGINDIYRNLVIYICGTTGSNNAEAYVGDYYHQDSEGKLTWTHYGNYNFSAAWEVYSIDSTQELLYGDYSGNVYIQQSSLVDDASTTINTLAEYVTDLEVPGWEKTFRKLFMYVNSTVAGPFTILNNFDFGQESFTNTVQLGASSGDLIGSTFKIGFSRLGAIQTGAHEVGVPGHGRFVTFQFSAAIKGRVRFAGFIAYAGLRRVLSGGK